MDGATRLVDGSTDPQGQFEYGWLEIFAQGFWSNICNNDRFTPDSAQVACRALGYDGGGSASLHTVIRSVTESGVRLLHFCLMHGFHAWLSGKPAMLRSPHLPRVPSGGPRITLP